jgi:NADPH:quinone reductase-like Zn-dependent oxidoreductase
VPVSATTALVGVRAAQLVAGQSVLITGAGGGVGSYAVQLARALGAEVTGVCSTSKIDFVRSLGAAQVIDYTHEDFTPATAATTPSSISPAAQSLAKGHSRGKAVITVC